MFSLSDYHYILPEELIAQEAIHPHHDARMMVIDRETGNLVAESTFWNIDQYLGEDRVIFFNDSRVVRSRISLTDAPYTKNDWTTGVLQTGEIFYLQSNGQNEFEALVKPGNKFKIGTTFIIGDYTIEVVDMTQAGRKLKITNPQHTIEEFLETHGSLPLPPYIEYQREKEADYQTSFAKNDGSVAAPTASLHFTSKLMEKIGNPKEYITLHVWLGTFKGIQTPDIRDYQIHSEKIEISMDIFAKIASIRENNQKIVAVGTTATRTLESLPYLWKKLDQDMEERFDAKTRKYWDTLTEEIKDENWIHAIIINNELWILGFDTSIYITPGYQFHIVYDLVTNFHLGESSLLVLVSAFIWYEETMQIYKYAVENRYRFYSFGDGMYIKGR